MSRVVRFLVVEPQMLVQMDLAESLREVSPEADVIAVASLAAAERAIVQWDSLTGAVVGVDANSLRQSGLGARIATLGGWVICLEDRHGSGVAADGWMSLPRPVFSDDLRHLVRSMMNDQSSRPAAC